VSLQETPLKLKAVVDDKQKNKMFLGHRIQSSDALNSMSFDKILITTISTKENPVEILMGKNIDKDKIVVIQ
jgi:hypothetical protein